MVFYERGERDKIIQFPKIKIPNLRQVWDLEFFNFWVLEFLNFLCFYKKE